MKSYYPLVCLLLLSSICAAPSRAAQFIGDGYTVDTPPGWTYDVINRPAWDRIANSRESGFVGLNVNAHMNAATVDGLVDQLQETVSVLPDYKLIDKGVTDIDGEHVGHLEATYSQDDEIEHFRQTIFLRNNIGSEVICSARESAFAGLRPTFDKFVSSFRFTTYTPATSTLSEHRVTKYGYSVIVPPTCKVKVEGGEDKGIIIAGPSYEIAIGILPMAPVDTAQRFYAERASFNEGLFKPERHLNRLSQAVIRVDGRDVFETRMTGPDIGKRHEFEASLVAPQGGGNWYMISYMATGSSVPVLEKAYANWRDTIRWTPLR